MAEITELLEEQNKLLSSVLQQMKEMNDNLANREKDTCSPAEALKILNLNNPRYLKHFYMLNLLNRRRGGSGWVYFKAECHALSEKFKSGALAVPSLREIYNKDAA